MDYLRRLLAESSDAVICLDDQQRVVVWNEPAARVFGVPSDAALGSSLEQVAMFAKSPILGALLRAAVGGQSDGRSEHVITQADGSVAVFEVNVTRPGDNVVALVAHDVTAIRRAEERLRDAANAAQTMSQSTERF